MPTSKPDLTRVWAEGAPGGNVVDPDTTTPGKFNSGWTAEVPPFEHFNFLQQLFTQGLAYNNEQGINTWDTNTVYPLGAIVKASDLNFYISVLEQSGNDPVSDVGTNWILHGSVSNARWFGVVADGTTDDTVALQAAIDAGPTYINVIPGQSSATCAIDSMLQVGFNQSLYIGAGVTLSRLAANSSSTDPVIWIDGNNAIVAGGGLTQSFITTENRCPLGVVRQGHADMTQSHDNVNYTTLRDLGIFGSTDGGQTTGAPDICVYRANPTIGVNQDSFFATLKNLRVNSANYGIVWQGDANADTVDNIYGQNLGNTTLTTDRAMFSLEGCADHKFSNCFFHLSAGSDMMVFKDLDNSGTAGGKLHVGPSACSFTNMVGEQSSPGRWLVAEDGVTSGARNFVQGVDNSGGSFSVGDTWLASNTVNNSDGHFQRRRINVNGASGETGTSVRMTGDTPSFFLNEQDQALDEKKWDLVCANGELLLRVVSDDELDASNVMTVARSADSITSTTFGIGPNSVAVGEFDDNATAGETRFLLYDVSAGTLVRVSRGTADSGGSGFRVLRIPN